MMKAGRSQFECGTLVRVVKVTGVGAEDLVGVTGVITQPFPGLMCGSPEEYLAGIMLDTSYIRDHGPQVNLRVGDEVEAVAIQAPFKL